MILRACLHHRALFFAALFVAALAGCVTSGGGGGGPIGDSAAETAGSADASAGQDGASTGADGTTAGADAAAIGQDTAAATDGKTTSDGSTADATSGGETVTTSDVAPPKDTTPSPDAAPKPDVSNEVSPADAGPGPTGPYDCQTACINIGSAQCPDDDPLDKCVQGCQGFVAKAAKCPADKVQAFLKCASVAKITCTPGGSADVPVECKAIMNDLAACLDGGPPPPPDPCAMGPCYGDDGNSGDPFAKQSCGCSSQCNGMTVALDCDGSKCVCKVNGQQTTSFDQGEACKDPQGLMKAACAGNP